MQVRYNFYRKGEKVKNCSQWENHEPSSRRGTLGMDAGNNVCAKAIGTAPGIGKASKK